MSMKMIVLTLVASLLAVGAWPRLLAQAADQSSVQDAVEGFLLHLGDGEFDKVGADLAPKSLVIVARERDGQQARAGEATAPGAAPTSERKWTNTYQTGEEWLAALRRNEHFVKFREPLTNVRVTIDSNALAYLRADFQVVREGKAVSHGVDQFTLVREGDRWKLAAVAYTSTTVR
jgi:hypothetical protein